MMRRLFAFLGVIESAGRQRTLDQPRPGQRKASRGGALFFASFRRAQRPERFSVTASPKESWLAERFESR
jgi:hypothetical protein